MISTQILQQHPIFAQLSSEFLSEIALISKVINLEAETWLFYEEDDADEFFILLEGKIQLSMNIYQEDKVKLLEALDPIGTNQIIGWSAMIPPHVYTMGGRTKEKSKVLAIAAQAFRNLLDNNPTYGYFFMKNIGEIIGARLEQQIMQFMSLVIETDGIPKEKLYTSPKSIAKS